MYKSMKDVNPSIKGIEPSVTLAQANAIAAQADAISSSPNPPDSPWAAAISSFKKSHEVKDGKWVKKEKMEEFGAAWKLNVDGTDVTIQDLVETYRAVNECGEEATIRRFYNVTSFQALDAAKNTDEATHEIKELVDAFSMIFENIIYSQMESQEKLDAFNMLAGEFSQRMASKMGLLTSPEMDESAEPIDFEFEESFAGLMVDEFDDEFHESSDGKPATHLRMRIKIIQPGWGNRVDNHYYPPETLARDAHVWVGSKMYETNHRASEKSNRTWVSTIESLAEPLPDGSPTAWVAVHDPGFAERVRNLKELGLLEKLENSITGGGKARPFELDGRRGKYVEAITRGGDVDWVTSAGAGGHALSLAESDEGGSIMQDNQVEELGEAQEPEVVETDVQETELAESAQDEANPETEETVENAEPEIQEETVNEESANTESEPSNEDVTTGEDAQESDDVVFLTVEEVAFVVEMSNLPDAAQRKLKEGEYASVLAVKDAIAAEREYLQAVTKAGKPFNMGESAQQEQPTMTLAELQKKVEEAMREVNQKHGFTRHN